MDNICDRFSRTALLIGDEQCLKLSKKRILAVGTGGVGGYAVENVVRAGIGNLTLVDGDNVDITNCNRQIIALTSAVGRKKVDVLAERCREINPEIKITAVGNFLKKPEDITRLLENSFDFVIDAIDDVPVKVELIRQLKEKNIPFISSMGAGGKTDPTQITIADLSKTCGCPLARIMRSKLKELKLTKGIATVYSPEVPHRSFDNKKIGSISYIPAIFGCFCAAAAIDELISK